MKKKNLILLIVILVIVLIVYGLVKWQTSPGKYDDFANCLTENGVKMYGTSGCSYCNKQKALFGKSFENINFIDCDKDQEACIINNVQGYPTWKINGDNYPGLQQLNRLSQLSGCGL